MNVNVLTNPIVLKMLGTFVIAVLAFIIAVLWIRGLRKEILEDSRISEQRPAALGDIAFSLAAYNGVIQKLKEQETELQRLRQSERGRAATSESVSEAVLSNLASGVLLFANNGMVRHANPSARAILGFGALFGMHARDIFRRVSGVRREGMGETTPDALVEAIDQCLRHGLPFRRIEADYQTPAGERRVLGITVSPVRGTLDEALGAACLISDLTEITDLSRQMRERDKMSALGEMSAGIAHEFKNSLATISGYAQMLTRENDPATTQQFAAKIVGETQNLTRVVTDFLNFARPQELETGEVPVRALIEECVQECGECGMVADLSRLSPEVTLTGDRTALRQAFSNLLRNSVEAAAGRPLRVVISAEAEGSNLRLYFRDDGPGISAENLPRVFIPFFTTKAQGTGLGLALVQRIVTEHGGTVKAESSPAGTLFTLSFPVKYPVPTTVSAD
ncbi:MAG: ATP-binding protein [Acidobacteriota bacterium]|nr:ATP-binding protein [Acidobacteriota bacterium]